MFVFLKYPLWYGILGILLCLLYSQGVYAEFSIKQAKTYLDDHQVFLLNAAIDYGLTDETIEALKNGVPLILVLDIYVERGRWYLWDETVAALKQRYQLKYHALSQQYTIKYLNTGIQDSFPSLDGALAAIGTITDLPLLDHYLIEPNENYSVYLRSYLDIESLPAPLRPAAYFSSKWRLITDWYSCPLQPSLSKNGSKPLP